MSDIGPKTAAGFPIALCRSCGADIVWTLSVKGKRQPIDAEPVAGGTIRIFAGRPLTNRVVGAVIDLFDETDTGDRYQPHHMTCPTAHLWRKSGEPRPDTPGPKRNRR
jgi:hypothetical protein